MLTKLASILLVSNLIIVPLQSGFGAFLLKKLETGLIDVCVGNGLIAHTILARSRELMELSVQTTLFPMKEKIEVCTIFVKLYRLGSETVPRRGLFAENLYRREPSPQKSVHAWHLDSHLRGIW
jgi:hypothetical protein